MNAWRTDTRALNMGAIGGLTIGAVSRAILGVILGVMLGLTGCRHGPPDVIVVLADTLRADRVARLEALYDAEIAALDRELERLFAALRARGLLEHTVVIVTADHGEEFRDHGGLLHGTALFQESVRIPLIMTGPGLPAGRVVGERVSLVDVAPTLLELLLELLGLPAEPRFEGRSLRDLASAEERDVVLQLFPIAPGPEVRRHVAGLVSGSRKLLVPPPPRDPTVFDLEADPGEHHPDPPALSGEADRLRARLDERARALATRAGAAETVPLDAATRERLRALGYAH